MKNNILEDLDKIKTPYTIIDTVVVYGVVRMTGLDMHLRPEMGADRGSHQCLHWWQELSTGQFLCYGFESVQLPYKKRTIPIGTVLFLVRMTGLEPARQRQRNLNPPSLPIPPHPHSTASLYRGILSRTGWVVNGPWGAEWKSDKNNPHLQGFFRIIA